MMSNTCAKQIQKQAALKHTKLYLEKVKKWSVELSTDKAAEIFREMDQSEGNINKALARLSDPYWEIPPEVVRDSALIYYDYYTIRSRWSEWINLGILGLKACDQLGDNYSLGQAYPKLCNCLGIAHRMTGNFIEAMFYYQKALERVKRNEEKSDALTNMADIYRLRIPPETPQALQCSEQAIQLAQEIGDKDREAKAWEYQGLAHVGLGRKGYDFGIICYEQALGLRRETGNLARIAITLSYLSFTLAHRGKDEDFKKALKYYQEARGIEEQLRNNQSLGRLDGDIAVTYNKLGEYEKAKTLSEKAYTENLKAKYWRGATLNQARLLNSYMGLNNLNEALKCADYICENQKFLSAFDRCNLHDLSGNLVKLSQHQRGRRNFDKAKDYAQLALELAIATEESNSKQVAEQLLQQSFSKYVIEPESL